MEKILTQGRKFVDEGGRERIFNGVNLCDKGAHKNGKRVYELPFDEKVISRLAENGFNIVRLGIIWDAVEPQPRKYDEEYLDRVQAVADLCEKYGIYFYLDMHQDLYASNDAGGDGAPLWAAKTGGAEFKPAKFVWAEGYFWGKAVQNSFTAFWNNEKVDGVPLQTYFQDMWKHVAERFKDHPALFGFDVLNEPYPGVEGGKVFRSLIANVVKTGLLDKRFAIKDAAKNVLSGNVIACLDPFADYSLFRKVTRAGDRIIKEFDTGAYSSFINATAAAIREVTDNGIILMENSYYSNLGIPYSAPAVTVNGERESKLCFAPHAYDFMVDTPEYKYASNTRVGGIFDEHRRSQQRLDVPLIVGEWGGTSDGTDWLHHIRYLLDKFDSFKWGQTYWAYYDGLLDAPIMAELRRTYAKAVSGSIDSYSWDRENNVYTLEYTQEGKFAGPTVIYLHAEPKEVEATGKYQIKGSELTLKTKPGKNKIVISF